MSPSGSLQMRRTPSATTGGLGRLRSTSSSERCSCSGMFVTSRRRGCAPSVGRNAPDLEPSESFFDRARARAGPRLPLPGLVKPQPAVREDGDRRRAAAVRRLAARVELAVPELEPVAVPRADEEAEPDGAALVPRPDEAAVLVVLEHGPVADL